MLASDVTRLCTASAIDPPRWSVSYNEQNVQRIGADASDLRPCVRIARRLVQKRCATVAANPTRCEFTLSTEPPMWDMSTRNVGSEIVFSL
jgi:hypothetical protein